MRFDAPAPYEGNFVEFSERWTVRQRREFFRLEGEPYIDLLRQKIVALHLDVEGREPITSPDGLLLERLDDIDSVLWEWFSGTPLATIAEVTRLGEAMRSQLFLPLETTTTASADIPTPS